MGTLRDGGANEVKLTRGSSGVFEITIDGRLAWSKKASGRFPTEDEVRALLPGG